MDNVRHIADLRRLDNENVPVVSTMQTLGSTKKLLFIDIIQQYLKEQLGNEHQYTSRFIGMTQYLPSIESLETTSENKYK